MIPGTSTWEGTLKRTNGNLGTVTTRTNAQIVTYGVSDRLTVLGTLPFVWTSPSQGVLQPQQGVQDLSVGAKYSVLERTSSALGAFRAIVGVQAAFPLTDYTPDFAPLSIGTQSRRVAARLTLNYRSNPGWYLNASSAYTSRADVTLDRPYFFTENQLFLSDTVPMPNVVDGVVSAGYLGHGLNANIWYAQQITQGGGDIRRQDMPFISNRVNASSVGVMAMYPIPKFDRLAFQVGVGRVVSGRNVGQSTTVITALLYALSDRGRLVR
ncbi:MAG: transporter [Vicinamibacterales bacterium]